MLIPILLLIACFRLPDFVAGVMANPLYIDLGFSKADIANVSKLYGVWIGIVGAFAAAWRLPGSASGGPCSSARSSPPPRT